MIFRRWGMKRMSDKYGMCPSIFLGTSWLMRNFLQEKA